MAPTPRLSVLMDELVEEVLLRFPPDDPGALVSAALVCKALCRLISAPVFRRRFREFHRTAPMLGVICNLRDEEKQEFITRFVPTSSSCSPCAGRRSFALDARHNRVLLYNTRASREDQPVFLEFDFVVWNPIMDEKQELPVLKWYWHGMVWKAAVLCAAAAVAGGGTCDHLDCHREPFIVVFMGIMMEHVFVDVYSSETGTWSRATHGYLGPLVFFYHQVVGSLLAEGAIHIAIEDGLRILSYNLSRCSLSVEHTAWNHRMGNMGLVKAEDGGLGIAGVEGYHLYLWSRCVASDGVRGWKQDRIIELDMMLSIDIGVPSTTFRVIGFADGAGTIFICASDGVYSVALESRQVKKVHGRGHFYGIVPYVSFYTPDVASGVLLQPAAHP